MLNRFYRLKKKKNYYGFKQSGGLHFEKKKKSKTISVAFDFIRAKIMSFLMLQIVEANHGCKPKWVIWLVDSLLLGARFHNGRLKLVV